MSQTTKRAREREREKERETGGEHYKRQNERKQQWQKKTKRREDVELAQQQRGDEGWRGSGEGGRGDAATFAARGGCHAVTINRAGALGWPENPQERTAHDQLWKRERERESEGEATGEESLFGGFISVFLQSRGSVCDRF